MKRSASRAACILILPLLIVIYSPSRADPVPEAFDPEEFVWAYGLVVDSIYIVGDTRTRGWVLIREMETRVGARLDRIKLARDQRFLTDLSPVASVDISVEPTEPGRCHLRLAVVERPSLLLRLPYPVAEYDINRDRWKVGVRWRDRNFRGRLESVSAGATRDSNNDDSFGLGWSTRWIGMKHLGVGANVSHFRRDQARVESSIMEQTVVSAGVALPLTDSRIAFSQLAPGMSLSTRRFGSIDGHSENEVIVSPSLTYRFDSRDSGLKPSRGKFFSVSLSPTRVINGEGSTYWLLRNDVRLFHSLGKITVVAMRSSLFYQFGEFPDYVRFAIGGAGSLRGYSGGQFRGNHAWIQTAELRFFPLPQWFFHLPFVGKVDIQFAAVAFVDGGIVWNNPHTFTGQNFRGGGGVGLRIYSPFQDVVRLDLGINGQGTVRPYFTTGVRF